MGRSYHYLSHPPLKHACSNVQANHLSLRKKMRWAGVLAVEFLPPSIRDYTTKYPQGCMLFTLYLIKGTHFLPFTHPIMPILLSHMYNSFFTFLLCVFLLLLSTSVFAVFGGTINVSRLPLVIVCVHLGSLNGDQIYGTGWKKREG